MHRFWQSIVDQDTDVALSLLDEPTLMVSGHGVMKFDHAGQRRMAEQGSMVLTRFELRDLEVVFPNDTTAVHTYRARQDVAPRGSSSGATQELADTSTWLRRDDGWRCVMHAETPLDAKTEHRKT